METVEQALHDAQHCSIEQEQIDQFVSDLRRDVGEVLDGWDRPDEPLRVTKHAIQLVEECPRKLTASDRFVMNLPVARGTIVDLSLIHI